MATPLHLLMHATAIKKNGALAEIAAVAGLAPGVAESVMTAAVASGRVLDIEGRFMLSPAGHMIVDSEYSRYCGALRANVDFVKAYERFESVNRDLKRLVTRWQTLEIGGQMTPNDHSDDEYDDGIISELGDLHERFEPILNVLISGDSRLKGYQEKLTAALEKAEDGDKAWVSDARIESYHTVWFELHEDLLRLLGRTRDE
jgi:hypothetical protein